jgi:DNA-binding NarL/FixJ family response regulator
VKRLLVIADHSLVIHGIRLALRQTAGFQVAGFLDGRSPITDALERVNPDIVLVDDMQRQDDALERLREISATCPQAKSLLLTQRMELEWLDEAFEAGAEAAISKTVHPVALGTMLREIAQGSIVHRREARAAAPPRETCPLTHREIEILGLVAEGYTNGRIARELWVTEQTVKFHLSNTYRKLGVANRTEASRYAFVHDLTEPRERLAHAS